MKSLSKIHLPASNARFETWNVSDLDIESNVVPADTQREEILQFFGIESKNVPERPNERPLAVLHPAALDEALVSWLPEEFGEQIDLVETQPWEFSQPSRDFVEIPEQQILQEKFEAEKERIELIRQGRLQAEEILQEARLEAEKIILLAHDEINHAKKDGYETAYKEMQDALTAVHSLVEETRTWQSSLVQQGEQVLVGMLKEIAQTMFGEGVQLDANALQINLNRIMESAQRLGDLNIFLNPKDASLLDPSWSSYQLLITGNKVRIVPSEKILPGGCFIKGSTGTVDARVDTQLGAVLNMFDEINEAGR